MRSDFDSVSRTLRALELLADGPLSNGDLALAVGVHPRTARRLLATLADEGYAARSPGDRGRYVPTRKLVALAGRIAVSSDVAALISDYVSALQARLKIAVFLCLGEEGEITEVLYDEGGGPRRVDPSLGPGAVRPCAAARRVVLAFRPDLAARALSTTTISRAHPSVGDPSTFLLELAETRQRGYLLDAGSDEISCSAPIFDQRGEVVAVLSVLAASGEASVDELCGALLETAQAASMSMGYAGKRPLESSS